MNCPSNGAWLSEVGWPKEIRVAISRSLQFVSFLCLLVLTILGAVERSQAQPPDGEYQVKAAFLFHFAQLVDWPPSVLNSGNQSIYLCMFNDEPHRQEVQNIIEGKIIATRVFRVRVLTQAQEIQGCNILFLGRDEARRQMTILRGLTGLPVLTVGETTNFLSDGGMIRFRLEGGKIRFDINGGGADSAHLRISSRLLLLATSVTFDGGADGGTRRHAR